MKFFQRTVETPEALAMNADTEETNRGILHPSGDGLQPPSDGRLLVMASNLLSILVAMASTLMWR